MGTFPLADNLLFFTELVSMPVLDVQGRRIGRVKDAALVRIAALFELFDGFQTVATGALSGAKRAAIGSTLLRSPGNNNPVQ